jgi:large subunit ribosomal protein L18e
MFANPVVKETIWTLRRAFKSSKAPIWRYLEQEISRARSIRREVNISRLASVTKNGEIVVVPGKVLGLGEMDHKLTVYAFSFSERARKNIIDVGGTVIGLDGLIGSYPDGKGVRVIG